MFAERASLLAEDVGILYHCGLMPADSLLYSVASVCESNISERLVAPALIRMLDQARIVSAGWPTSLVEPMKEVRVIVCGMEGRFLCRPEEAGFVQYMRPLFHVRATWLYYEDVS